MPSPFQTRVIATQQAGGPPGINNETLGANKTLVDSDVKHQRLDAGGGARDVILPAEEGSTGREFWIWNASDASENLVVKDDAAATIGTLNQNEMGCFVCTGSAWLVCNIITGAIT